MTPFRRATQFILLLLGVVAGLITFVTGYMVRMIIRTI